MDVLKVYSDASNEDAESMEPFSARRDTRPLSVPFSVVLERYGNLRGTRYLREDNKKRDRRSREILSLSNVMNKKLASKCLGPQLFFIKKQ